jgi:hypothetical protein
MQISIWSQFLTNGIKYKATRNHKTKWFRFRIVHFPFIWSNIHAAHTYGGHITQLIWYSMACGFSHDFIGRGYWTKRAELKSSLRKCYGRHHDLVNPCGNLCYTWPHICSVCRNPNPILSPFMTYHRVCNNINTAAATGGAGTAFPSGALKFTPGFRGVVLFNL